MNLFDKRVRTKEQYINYVKGNSTIGIPADGTQFVLPKNYCDDIASKAAGDTGYYEKTLGFGAGHFSDGGVPEAITDLIPNVPDNILVSEIK